VKYVFFDPLKIILVTKERFLISNRGFSNSIINVSSYFMYYKMMDTQKKYQRKIA